MSTVTPIRPYPPAEKTIAEQLEEAIPAIGEPQALLTLLAERLDALSGDERGVDVHIWATDWVATLRVANRLLTELWGRLEGIKLEAQKPTGVT
jgi:hypothetical protein